MAEEKKNQHKPNFDPQSWEDSDINPSRIEVSNSYDSLETKSKTGVLNVSKPAKPSCLLNTMHVCLNTLSLISSELSYPFFKKAPDIFIGNN